MRPGQSTQPGCVHEETNANHKMPVIDDTNGAHGTKRLRTKGKEVPLATRAGILALHQEGKKWVDISSRFGVHPGTARKIVKRAEVGP